MKLAFATLYSITKAARLYTVKFGYKEHAWTQSVMFVITVIRYFSIEAELPLTIFGCVYWFAFSKVLLWNHPSFSSQCLRAVCRNKA